MALRFGRVRGRLRGMSPRHQEHEEPMDRASAVVVESFPEKTFAEAVAALLATEGIESIVVADDAGGVLPNLDFARGVRLMVAPEDAERARELLAPVDEGEESAQE